MSAKLTKAECDIAARCIEFAQAGEWPWDAETQEIAEKARDKLRAHYANKQARVLLLAVEEAP